MRARARTRTHTAGNLHIIGYNIDRQPYLQYGVLSANSSLLK
jgi:hypothetical protein